MKNYGRVSIRPGSCDPPTSSVGFAFGARMSKGHLVPVPAPVPALVAPPKKRLRRGVVIALGLVLLAPVSYFAVTKAMTPEPRTQFAALKAEPVRDVTKEPTPEPPLITGSVAPSENPRQPLPKPRPAIEQKVAYLPILLPKPNAEARPSPAPVNGWAAEATAISAPATGGTQALVRYVNRDVDGADYRVLGNSRLDDCERQCQSDSQCQAFTFNTWENVCFLKSSANVLRVEPRGISGVRAIADVRSAVRPPLIERIPSKQFPGSPYRLTFQKNFDSCSWQCTADEQCLGFNYRKPDSSCGLFATLAKSVPAYATDAGMKWQPRYAPSTPSRRRAAVRPWRDMPSEAAIIFDSVVRQMMR